MSILEVLFLGAALSMDAFAVSVCKGLCLRKPTAAQCALAGIWFGSFQALMPADLEEPYRKELEAVFGEGSCRRLNVVQPRTP